MTASAHELLAAFDSLPPNERQQVTAEILRRAVGTDALPDAGFHELADELFRGYDAADATSTS